MDPRRLFRLPLACEGALSVEIALLIPVVFIVLWFLNVTAFSWRLEGSVNRATAAIADILANQRNALDEAMTDRIDRVLPDIGPLFVEMVTGESSTSSVEGEDSTTMTAQLRYGLVVTYYDSINQEQTDYTRQGTMSCSQSQDFDLSTLGVAGATSSLVTENNVGGLQLVKVDACVSYPRTIVETLIAPGEFSSTFIAVRREE